MEMTFTIEDAKLSFNTRMDNAKARLAPRGSPPLDKHELLTFNTIRQRLLSLINQLGQLQSQAVSTAPVTMLGNSGSY